MTTTSTLLARLIDAPDLVQTVRTLTPPTFAALVRHVGVEDAGELVALATTDQLVAAFDEDLFVNDRPGTRESFDRRRFVVWLEVLLEAGEEAAARRFTELSVDFVVQAVSSLVLVLDNDELMLRMGEGGEDARMADKAIESSLSEELEGYLLLSLAPEGWDAVLSLLLALDRDHHSYLDRILERCAALSSGCVEDLEELTTVLSEAESLAEDVEAEREERRSRLGYVEPRAARSFLTLARKPLATEAVATDRDPVTRAYFRDLEARPSGSGKSVAKAPRRGKRVETGASHGQGTGPDHLAGLLGTLGEIVLEPTPLLLGPATAGDPADAGSALMPALRELKDLNPEVYAQRLEELAYLTNVILAGTEGKHGRFKPAEAAEAALATVCLGAELEALATVAASPRKGPRARPSELAATLASIPADVLFRRASSALAERSSKVTGIGLLLSDRDIEPALSKLPRGQRKGS